MECALLHGMGNAYKAFVIRGSCSLVGFALLLGVVAPRARCAEVEKPKELLAPGLAQAIDRGLFFLQKQQRGDGSFEAAGPKCTMTALGLLAFLSAGHTPDVGKYGLTVRNAIDWLVNYDSPDRYYGADGGRMYGHCIATIALAQVYGLEADENQRRKLRLSLEKALKVILAAQEVGKDGNSAGGWRYERNSTDSDLSVTTWSVLAMHACRDAGLSVPRENFERALRYVLRCYRGQDGGLAYTVGGQVYSSITAAGLLDLYLLDATGRDEFAEAGRYVLEHPVRGDAKHFQSALFYTVVGGMHAGEDSWPGIWKNAYEQLVPMQSRDDGSWPDRQNDVPGGGKPGRFYPTAMAVMTLAAPMGLMPAYER